MKNAHRDAQDKEAAPTDQNRENEIIILSRDKNNESSTNNVRKDTEP